MIDECTPGRLLKKREAAVYSTDDGNKHIQGTQFRMASLKEEIMVFAPCVHEVRINGIGCVRM